MPIYILTISELFMLTAQRKEQVAIEEFAELGGNVVSFLYKSNILYVREVCRSGYGIIGTYGKPATLMEGG